jgi:hypothetical protein
MNEQGCFEAAWHTKFQFSMAVSATQTRFTQLLMILKKGVAAVQSVVVAKLILESSDTTVEISEVYI